MAILIDGYNLLHVTGIFSNAVGPGSLQKLHEALLDFLAAAIEPGEVRQTTVVFDAKGRRATTRRSFEYSGITVHYSARHEDADTLLAELIRDHAAPRQLTVVSSDHQVQRAARRRRAKAVDSDVWYTQVLRARNARQESATHPPETKPAAPLSESDAAWWLAQFAPELLQELEQEIASADKSPSDTSSGSSSVSPPQPPDKVPSTSDPAAIDAEHANYDALREPFPPSYLEAIQREFLTDAKSAPDAELKPTKGTRSRRKPRKP
jgi:predicted RNA-binding protein with PIN domain